MGRKRGQTEAFISSAKKRGSARKSPDIKVVGEDATSMMHCTESFISTDNNAAAAIAE